jgi:hypothetical protein
MLLSLVLHTRVAWHLCECNFPGTWGDWGRLGEEWCLEVPTRVSHAHRRPPVGGRSR